MSCDQTFYTVSHMSLRLFLSLERGTSWAEFTQFRGRHVCGEGGRGPSSRALMKSTPMISAKRNVRAPHSIRQESTQATELRELYDRGHEASMWKSGTMTEKMQERSQGSPCLNVQGHEGDNMTQQQRDELGGHTVLGPISAPTTNSNSIINSYHLMCICLDTIVVAKNIHTACSLNCNKDYDQTYSFQVNAFKTLRYFPLPNASFLSFLSKFGPSQHSLSLYNRMYCGYLFLFLSVSPAVYKLCGRIPCSPLCFQELGEWTGWIQRQIHLKFLCKRTNCPLTIP